jgi:hypothetical protein
MLYDAPMNVSERYTEHVMVRLSPKQKRALERIARTVGMTLSTYIRWRVVGPLNTKERTE